MYIVHPSKKIKKKLFYNLKIKIIQPSNHSSLFTIFLKLFHAKTKQKINRKICKLSFLLKHSPSRFQSLQTSSIQISTQFLFPVNPYPYSILSRVINLHIQFPIYLMHQYFVTTYIPTNSFSIQYNLQTNDRVASPMKSLRKEIINPNKPVCHFVLHSIRFFNSKLPSLIMYSQLLTQYERTPLHQHAQSKF